MRSTLPGDLLVVVVLPLVVMAVSVVLLTVLTVGSP